MKMTLFLQELWNQDKRWDNRLDEKDVEKWTQIMKTTSNAFTISTPRCVGKKDEDVICFSEKRVCCRCLPKIRFVDREINISLIFSN